MALLHVIIHKKDVASKTVVVKCYLVAGESELCVHRKLQNGVEVKRGAWVVTHRRTTFTLGSTYPTRDVALEALKRISAAELKWDFNELGKVDLTEHKRVMGEVFAALVGFDSGSPKPKSRRRRAPIRSGLT